MELIKNDFAFFFSKSGGRTNSVPPPKDQLILTKLRSMFWPYVLILS